MAGKDYYAILGVDKTAGPDEIKKAYRKRAIKFHPDHNQGDKAAEEKLKDINEAYAVLSNPEKKKQYDTFGAEGFGQKFSQEDIFRGVDFQSIFDDLGVHMGGGGVFDSLFGGGRPGGRGGRVHVNWGGPFSQAQGPQAAPKGRDASLELSIGFHESIHGGKRVISVPAPNGGWEQVTVKIPAGIEDGKRLRVKGKGQASPMGGPRGDVYLKIRVEADPVFTREGKDLRCEVKVPLSILVLGGSVDVPTLTGSRKVKVKAGTAAGARLRLKGQ
ncbi:MAG: J domain-containing protein, partial [Deltaproteobacteria bacterium]|nr:J domain-containing protein [Deltaproteobacteria bacterium]